MKMAKKTLDEIRKSMTELQSEITSLTTTRKTYVAEMDRLNSDEQDIIIAMDDDKEQLKSLRKFVSENDKGNLTPRMASRIKEKKNKIKTLERALATQKTELDKIKKEKTEIQKKPEYAETEKKLADAQSKLDGIFDILEQDPTINKQLQLAVKYQFKTEIDAQNKIKEGYEKFGKDLSKAMKDGSKDNLKTLVEELSESKKERDEADNDENADSNAAKKKFFDARKKLQDEIKSKFGIEIDSKDVEYILKAVSNNQLDNLSLPSATSKIQEADSMISKLETSRDTRLKELEAKKAKPQLQNTDLIEENRKKIEEFKNGIETILKPQIEALDTEIADIDTQIEDTDKKITKEEANLGEPSDEYKEAKKIEQELKDKHIVIEELVPELDDEKSNVSKKFEDFTKADLDVRKAFQKCKVDDSKEAMQELKDKISEYQLIALDLEDLTGYDIESWQNYLKEVLNDRIEEGETLDSAYYHTDNENLQLLEKDSAIRNNEDALDAYDELVEKTENIDKLQFAILNGKPAPASVDEAFNDPDKGYYSSIKELEKASGLDGGKGVVEDVKIFDLLKNAKMIQSGIFNKVKGFFSKLASKFKPKKFFEPPKDSDKLVKKYRDALTPEVKDEIKARRELENLKRDRLGLDILKVSKESEREKLAEKGTKALEEIQVLEDRNEELAREDAGRAVDSQIEQTDDLEFVTREDDIVKAYSDTRGKDDDDGR